MSVPRGELSAAELLAAAIADPTPDLSNSSRGNTNEAAKAGGIPTARPSSTTPPYLSNSSLFDAFKSSRVKAAASSLQARFSTSLQSLSKFEEYQKTKDGNYDPQTEAQEVKQRRDAEAAALAKLERSVMKPKLKENLLFTEFPPPPSQSSSNINSAISTPVLTTSMLKGASAVPSIASSMAPSAVTSPQRAAARSQQSQYQIMENMAPPPPHSPRYNSILNSLNTTQSTAVATATESSTTTIELPPKEPLPDDANYSDIVNASQTRVKHIKRAMASITGDDMQASVASNNTSFAQTQRLQPPIQPRQNHHHHAAHHAAPQSEAPKLPFKDTSSAASVSLPVSRPLIRRSPRNSPLRPQFSPDELRTMRRNASRMKKQQALPKHVERLLKIQSAHAAQAGHSSESEESGDGEERLVRRRSRSKPRLPDSPSLIASPKMKLYKPPMESSYADMNPQHEEEEEKQQVQQYTTTHAYSIQSASTLYHAPPFPGSSPAKLSRVPIHRLAEQALAEDQADDPRAFLVQPTPRDYLDAARLTSEQQQQQQPPQGTTVHVHLHSAEMGAPAVAPSDSPRMSAQHPTSWASVPPINGVNNYTHWPPVTRSAEEEAAHRSLSLKEEIMRDTMRYANISTNVDRDAEFDILHSLLTGDGEGGGQDRGNNAIEASMHGNAVSDRQRIDNYHYPPKLFGSSSNADPIIHTMLEAHDASHSATTRSTSSSHAHPNQFQYTQTVYQPSLHRDHHLLQQSHAESSQYARPNNWFSHELEQPPPRSSSQQSRSSSMYGSAPAHSFFLPNEPTTSFDNVQLGKYPPVLRSQLKQILQAQGINPADERDFMAPVTAAAAGGSSFDSYRSTLHSSFDSPATSRRGRSRTRNASPDGSRTSHLADTSLMSPTRLAAYLRHYLQHRVQITEEAGTSSSTHVTPSTATGPYDLAASLNPSTALISTSSSRAAEPPRVQLTREEVAKLHKVIVELDSLRSAHELSAEGQQIITSLQTVPSHLDIIPTAHRASSPTSSSSLSQKKVVSATSGKKKKNGRVAWNPSVSPPLSPRRLKQQQQQSLPPESQQRPTSAAARRSQLLNARHNAKEDAKLTGALLKIAREREAEVEFQFKHKVKLDKLNRNKPATIDTGLAKSKKH